MSTETIKLPDIGVSEAVEIIEISVKVGDDVSAEDTLLVLESDKASMDIPAPHAGRISKVLVSEGDKVSTGDPIIEMAAEGEAEAPAAEAAPQQAAPEAAAPQPAATSTAAPAQSTTRIIDIHVPDLSGSDDVPIIELAVSAGDTVEAEDSLITLESDKASMDIPAPHAGRIVSLAVKEGDHVSTGDLIGQMEITEQGAPAATEAPVQAAPAQQPAAASSQEDVAPVASAEPQRREVRVPDIGGSENVPVIEVAISVGDEIGKEDTLITLESDKASMDVPSPFEGKVVEVAVKEGDKLSEGDLIGYIETAGEALQPTAQPVSSAATAPQQAPAKAAPTEPSTEALSAEQRDTSSAVHAGPAVRMLARELGVNLAQVNGAGPKGRVLKEDVHAFVKQRLNQPAAAAKGAATSGAGIPQVPAIDFAKFGEIEVKPMGRLLQAGANNLHRSWLNVPHVTQFDEADITELEAFRKSMKDEAAQQGARLTPLPFMIKACAYALRKFPQFNVSLHPDGDKLVWKNYVHIGIAVDTPDGLMVPVLRNADQKSVTQIAIEMADLAKRAQGKKLTRDEMTGGCFTISSLGSIGGTAFTPIVNTPEVAILGISKAQMKPVWDGSAFQPRLMLPLCLSYDHRALNGADGARFTTYLAQLLGDIRRLVM